MNAATPISRRGLLGLVTGTVLAMVTGGFRRGHDLRTRRAVLLAAVALSESHRVVGRAYLATLPAPPDISDLIAGIVPEDRMTAATDPEDPRELRRDLQRRIEDDFDQGRTVRIEGWVLADTEARLALLSVLI